MTKTNYGIGEREILFRGQRVDNGEWVEGFYEKDYENNHVISFSMNDRNKAFGMCRVLVKPETVGQYTGLKDKNGKEIYEGDILNTQPHSFIIFKDGAYRIDGDNVDHFNLSDLLEHWPVPEKIGDIFQNPELLTNK